MEVPEISVRLGTQPEKTRAMFRYSGVVNSAKFGVHNNSIVNIHRGLVERVFRVERDGSLVRPPRPNSRGAFARMVSRFSSDLKCHRVLPLSSSQFCERYSGRRRMVYERAAESLLTSPVCERDANLQTFVKAEKLNLSAKHDPAPRVIQPRNPRYNIEVGRRIGHLEKPLFKAIARCFGRPTVMKGYNALQTGKIFYEQWTSFHRPVAVGLDASRFDQHVSAAALQWEHSIWERFMEPSEVEELRRLLSWQVHNRGVAFSQGGRIKYKVEGCRMSGDMNTSSGNCLIMCALVYSFLHQCGLTTSDFWLANNGDDCVVVMESHNLPRIQNLAAWFLRAGFNMQIEAPVYVLEKVVFCQTQPVYTERGWTMVRDPHVAMAKDLTVNCDISSATHRATWLQAVREGGLALTDGVPVWPTFYSMFKGKGGYRKNQVHEHLCGSGWWRLSHGLQHAATQISAQARYSFWRAFDILPDEQAAIEARLSALSFSAVDGPQGIWEPLAEPILPGLLGNFIPKRAE